VNAPAHLIWIDPALTWIKGEAGRGGTIRRRHREGREMHVTEGVKHAQ
jgi:hypothetical protein